MFFGFFLHYIVNTRSKTSVVQSLAVGKLTSGFPNRVLNMSLLHMKITEVSKSWPSGDTLYSVSVCRTCKDFKRAKQPCTRWVKKSLVARKCMHE